MGILLGVLAPIKVAILALKVNEMAHTPLSLAFFLDDVIPDQSLFQSSGSVRVFSGSFMRESHSFMRFKTHIELLIISNII